MIPNGKKKQFSKSTMRALGITIHNTKNDKSAQENYELMMDSKREAGAHIFVDESDAIQALPYDMNCWHTGKAYDVGNMHTIAIEICRSTCDRKLYMKAQKNAIKVIQNLMRKYKFTNENIYFHQDFNERYYCPHRILEIYGSKDNFIKEELNGNKNNA